MLRWYDTNTDIPVWLAEPSTLLTQAGNLPERGSAAGQVGARIGNLKTLLYNPDNGLTRNFMPHLCMFLLPALTPRGHEVVLIDGNTRPMSDAKLVSFADEQIGVVGIGAMTRMVAEPYRVADAVRAAGIPVAMGGLLVTQIPDVALGRDGGPCPALHLLL